MDKKDFLNRVKDTLNEIIESTPYDLMEFNNREEEEKYINNKTKKFDISNYLLNPDGCDGIIVITENSLYAISPVFIHSDAFIKLLNYINNEKKRRFIGDPIEYYTDRGNILMRLVNNNGVIGFDSYLPTKLSDYQIRELEKVVKELNYVYKEIEYIDDRNAKNIDYGIRTIRDAVKENELIKKK